MLLNIGAIVELFSDDDVLACPHCAHKHDLTDQEVYRYVVSYWGEEAHDFTCSECDRDFLVKEIITRKYETAKDHEELAAL